MAKQVQELVSTSLGEMRAAASLWETLEPQERRRRIREYLVRQASSASIEPDEFARAVAESLPGPPGGVPEAASMPPARMRQVEVEPEPKDPVLRIIELTQALNPADRKRLIDRMRDLELIPTPAPLPAPAPIPSSAPVAKPVEVAPPPQPAPAPRPISAPIGVATSGGAAVGDAAFLALAEGLGVSVSRKGGGTLSVEEVEAALAKQGLKRTYLKPDALAFALGYVVKSLATHSEEGQQNPNGLPQALWTVFPNIKRAPVEQVKIFLAGGSDPDKLNNYLEDYFEPYRELSRKLPDLCRKLKSVAEKLSPRDLERNPPKSYLGAVAWDKVWEQYKERYSNYAKQGFGETEDSTRAWLLKQWLN